jgi:photosystem II stability/assembly factor-like uncharacterized protein
MKRSLSALIAAFCFCLPCPPVEATDAVPRPAEIQPLVLRESLILDFAEGANRAIAVGERGHIAVSESRSDWRQVEGVPTRATLTAVTARGDRAWAVGHDGTILASRDGGLTWELQRVDAWTPAQAEALDSEFDPAQGAPLLDVIALDDKHVIAIGAYSLMLVTRDGGSSWQRVDPNAGSAAQEQAEDVVALDAAPADEDWTMSEESLVLEDEAEPHLNGIARTPDGLLMVVGERGSAYRSMDNGDTWQRLRLPYDGSMFGVLSLGANHLLAFGLRGNVQESLDGGQTWLQPDSGTQLSLQGGTVLADGSTLLVGSNGVVLQRSSGASEFRRSTFVNDRQESPVLSAVLPLSARELMLAGEKGISRFSMQ